MAADVEVLLQKGRALASSYAENLLAIYAEKGPEPFKKPLIVALPVLAVMYFFVYYPLGGRIDAASAQLVTDEAIAQSAGEYSEVRDNLTRLLGKLPPVKEKDDWLNNLLSNSVKPYGLSFDQLSPQAELTAGSFVVASRNVEISTSYDILGRWIADLETSPKFVRVAMVVIAKNPSDPLMIKASVTVSTLFYKGPAGGGAS